MNTDFIMKVSGAVLIASCLSMTGCASVVGSWDRGRIEHGVLVIEDQPEVDPKKGGASKAETPYVHISTAEEKRLLADVEKFARTFAATAPTGGNAKPSLWGDHLLEGMRTGCSVKVKVYSLAGELESEEYVNVCKDKK